MTYYVNYVIVRPGMAGNYQAGPYDTFQEAADHRSDIRTYDGVQECFIGQARDETRTLVNSR